MFDIRLAPFVSVWRLCSSLSAMFSVCMTVALSLVVNGLLVFVVPLQIRFFAEIRVDNKPGIKPPSGKSPFCIGFDLQVEPN